MNSVLITGASSGIGLDTARELIEHEYHVFGGVRKEEDAQRLTENFGDRITPLIFDVRDQKAIDAAAVQVEKILGENLLSGVINNAGIVVAGPLMHLKYEDVHKQFEVNVQGVLNVTRRFLPLLGAIKNNQKKPGRIVNISSVSGRISYPFIGPYAASKHALESISASLRRELMLYGIDVILIEPGNTDTPIWDKARTLSEFSDTDYAEIIAHLREGLLNGEIHDLLPVSKVSHTIRIALTARKPKIRYAVVKRKLMGWYLPRLLPERWLDRIIAQRLGMI
jgi:NAD(P)-dependent dehydrogenase (short-subunit alcohol dehydrogenase family)